jgi:hypothetical protein
MTNNPTIRTENLPLDGDAKLWDVMDAALRAKEAQPNAALSPAMLVLRSSEIIAMVYQSSDEPRTLLVRSCTGVRKISLGWYNALAMMYRTAVLTMQQMEGTAVIFLGERADGDAGRAVICAMKWTARQFMQQPPRGATFPQTQDCISQFFYLDDQKVRWLPEASTALQFL